MTAMPAPDGRRGFFLTLEGIDGSGKSTQAALLKEKLSQLGLEVVALREPGGTPLGERIRALLLDPQSAPMAEECELMLYEASRAQLVRQIVEPALARGALVLCDRFYDSTYAYQAGGRGLDEALVRRCNEIGCCGVVPDLTVVFDLPAEVALERATIGGADRMEAEGVALQQRVRQAYLALVDQEPDRVRLVDAEGTVEEVFGRFMTLLKDSPCREFLARAAGAYDVC